MIEIISTASAVVIAIATAIATWLAYAKHKKDQENTDIIISSYEKMLSHGYFFDQDHQHLIDKKSDEKILRRILTDFSDIRKYYSINFISCMYIAIAMAYVYVITRESLGSSSFYILAVVFIFLWYFLCAIGRVLIIHHIAKRKLKKSVRESGFKKHVIFQLRNMLFEYDWPNEIIKDHMYNVIKQIKISY